MAVAGPSPQAIAKEHERLFRSATRDLGQALTFDEGGHRSAAIPAYSRAVQSLRRLTRLQNLPNLVEVSERQAKAHKYLQSSEARLAVLNRVEREPVADDSEEKEVSEGILSRIGSLFSLSSSQETPISDTNADVKNQPEGGFVTDNKPALHTRFGTAPTRPGVAVEVARVSPQPRPQEQRQAKAESKSALVPGLDKALQHRILDELLCDVGDVRWDDVAGLGDAKEALSEVRFLLFELTIAHEAVVHSR
jgi:SpoVK/Ycf46/Vps4 family AAA+-type ATPase